MRFLYLLETTAKQKNCTCKYPSKLHLGKLAQVQSMQIAAERAEAEAVLQAALPALEEAARALNDLKKDDITEIRSFAKPHTLVQQVCSTAPFSILASHVLSPELCVAVQQ